MRTTVAAPVAPFAPACTVASHEAIKADPARFSALAFHSYWPVKGTRVIEQRHCPFCHSTLGRLAEVATVRYLSDEDSSNSHSMIGGAA